MAEDEKNDKKLEVEDEVEASYVAGYDWDFLIEVDQDISKKDVVLWIKSKEDPNFTYEDDEPKELGGKYVYHIPRTETEKFPPGQYKWMLAVYDPENDRMENTTPQSFTVDSF